MPAQDRVGPYEQQEVAQFVLGEVVEQAGEDGEIGVGEVRLPDLALEDQQLVPQRGISMSLSLSLMGRRRRNARALVAAR